VREDVPVLGHCLGGQLMSKALGGTVRANPVKEIGWGPVEVLDCPEASAWFGDVRGFLSFHWHGETFSIPEGSVRVASSAACANQAFVLGPHLGMQCHVEMTPDLVNAWCESGGGEIQACACASVQQVEEIRSHLKPRLSVLNGVAERLYDRWIAGLRR
jgi:GMP synthase-like glutamine amidotransferase